MPMECTLCDSALPVVQGNLVGATYVGGASSNDSDDGAPRRPVYMFVDLQFVADVSHQIIAFSGGAAR